MALLPSKLGLCNRIAPSSSTLRVQRLSTRVRAAAVGQNGSSPDPEVNKKVDQLLEELKNAGLTKEKAQQLLNNWVESGAGEPEALKDLLIQRVIKPLQVLLTQTAIDAAGAASGFYVGYYIGTQDEFFGQPAVQLLANLVGVYFLLQSLIEFAVLSSCFYSAYRYGSNSAEVLVAVRKLAEPANIVEKATVAVSTVRVIRILDEIQSVLQYEKLANQEPTTLQTLRAYLVLVQAKEKLGFQPEKYGLNDQQAANIARCFADYDSNDDGRLETSEIGKLCSSLGKTLSEAELDEAVRVLDTNNNGNVDFVEWVAWWCNRQQAPQKTNK